MAPELSPLTEALRPSSDLPASPIAFVSVRPAEAPAAASHRHVLICLEPDDRVRPGETVPRHAGVSGR